MLLSLTSDKTDYSIEHIFINDGSTDRSMDILSGFLQSYPLNSQIIVNQSNLGVAAAYQQGLSRARGKYIGRIDADDWIEPEAINIMLRLAYKNDSDIVVAPYYLEKPHKKPKIVPPINPLSTLNDLSVDITSFALWGKIIRRSLLIDNDINTIPGVDCWEDLYILSRIYAITSKIDAIDTPAYHHFVDSTALSVSRKDKNSILHDRITYTRALSEWFQTHNLDIPFLPFLDRLKFYAKIKLLRAPGRNIPLWIRTFPEINKRIMQIKLVPLPVKIGARILSFLPSAVISDKDNV